jgi:hypothetical protein
MIGWVHAPPSEAEFVQKGSSGLALPIRDFYAFQLSQGGVVREQVCGQEFERVKTAEFRQPNKFFREPNYMHTETKQHAPAPSKPDHPAPASCISATSLEQLQPAPCLNSYLIFEGSNTKFRLQPIARPNPDGLGHPISLSSSLRRGGLSTDPSSAWETNGPVPASPRSFPSRCARPLPSTCGAQ